MYNWALRILIGIAYLFAIAILFVILEENFVASCFIVYTYYATLHYGIRFSYSAILLSSVIFDIYRNAPVFLTGLAVTMTHLYTFWMKRKILSYKSWSSIRYLAFISLLSLLFQTIIEYIVLQKIEISTLVIRYTIVLLVGIFMWFITKRKFIYKNE